MSAVPAPAAAPAAAAVVAPAPAAPAGRAAPRGRHVAQLALLASAQFVVMLDTSIVNVALPSIREDLGLSATGLTWVVNAYVLAFAGLLLVSGRVADLFGRRAMFVAGSAIFLVGTVLASVAASGAPLIAGRVVQGIGAAALSPAAMSLLLVTFAGTRKARALGVWGAASALGGASGVAIGGLLAGGIGWRFVFLVTLPVSALAIVAARRLLEPGATSRRRPLDAAGSATVTATVVALAFATLHAAEHGWTAPGTVTALAVSATLGAAFIAIERRVPDPIVPLEIFRSPGVGAGTALALLGGAVRASTFVLVALFLQDALAMAPSQAGLAMVPTSLTGFVFSLAVLPRLVSAWGPRRTLVAGLVVLAAGHLWIAQAPVDAGYTAGVLPGLVLVAIGVAASFTPTTMVVAGAMDRDHAGLASGLTSTGTQIGAAIGTAVFTAVGFAADAAGQGRIGAEGFSASFTAAATVSLITAGLGIVLLRSRTRTRDGRRVAR